MLPLILPALHPIEFEKAFRRNIRNFSTLADLICLLTLFWVVRDWATSTADPYPYGEATGVCLPACLAYVAYPIFSSQKGLRWLLVVLAGAALLASFNGGIVVAGVALLVFICLEVIRKYASERPAAILATAVAALSVAGFLIVQCRIFAVHAGVTSDPWLGQGIGTSSISDPAALGIAWELGIPGLALLTAALLAAVVIGTVCSIVPAMAEDGPARQRLSACSTAVLLGLLAGAAAGTMPAVTGAIALSAALMGGLVAVREPAQSKPRAKKKRYYAPILASVFVCAVIACWGALNGFTSRLVAPYARGEWGSATGHTPLNGVTQPMQDATIAMEDHAFYAHHGFDWIAIHHALRLDVREGQIKEGGSTLTQQLAKNLFLSSDRTLWRKMEEAALAWQMERMLSKRRILELYLNTIDYGMGQRGILNAAQYYFHKTPAQLTLAESAILVGSVPDPMHQQLDLQRVSEGERTALGRIVFFYPQTYTQSDMDHALAIPLDQLIYPYKDAWDRGATQMIPASWHGVSFYFFADPGEPLPIEQTAQCFKDRLAGFLDDAHKNLHLTGIDHLGLYNDRTTRFSQVDLSAHAFGQALDMSGFQFADGTHIKVVDHRDPRVMKRLAPVEAMLNRHFDAVVDWNDNPLHQTHFHVEVKGPRSTAPRAPAAASQ